MKYKYTLETLAVSAIVILSACQKSLEEKAAEDAREYTRKYCPTPAINYTRTDSVVFNVKTHVYTYYCTFTGAMDNQDIIDSNKKRISEALAASVRESTTMKPYVQAGFHFEYICRSEKDPDTILLQLKF